MVQFCQSCGAEFACRQTVGDIKLNLRGRKRCLNCLAHRPLRKPRKPVLRPVRMKLCESCRRGFAAKMVVGGRVRSLYRRRFCTACSPFGTHNTSKHPPGIAVPEELKEHRRRRRNAKTYRYQKKRRRQLKTELVEERGGRCESCGYNATIGALEFHHRDPASKEFGLGAFAGSRERLRAEAEKCDLLCPNCHRLRHALREAAGDPLVELRRQRKMRAVTYMGGRCFGCERDVPPSVYEFHHRNAAEKNFGISEDGIARRWEKTVAELGKCVMLCANCHREVHLGVRAVVA